MTEKKNNFLANGIIMIIIGAIIAFFPGVIVMLLKGILIIAGIIFIVAILHGIFGGEAKSLSGAVIGAVVVVVMYIFSDKIISFGIGVIGGIAISVMGVKRIIRAIRSDDDKDLRIINAVLGAILLAVGILSTFNPFDVGWVARLMIGISMIVNGIFNLFAANEYKKRLDSMPTSNIIDVESFTIDK